MPSVAHIIYIPAVFIIGLIVGYIAGSKAVRKELATSRRRAKR